MEDFPEVESVFSLEALRDQVDEILQPEFELFELEGTSSVYFSFAEHSDVATAEIRLTTPREQGYSEGGPQYHLNVTSSGPDPDNKSNWFDLESAVTFGEKQIKKILRLED